MGRCLVHSCQPTALVSLGKDWVARGQELMAFGETARVLTDAGVPLARPPAYAATGGSEDDAVLELLHPRIQGALLGRWGDSAHRERLELQGLRRIDVLVMDLPESIDFDAPNPEDLAAALLLRAAAWNHRWVLPVCDLDDLGEVLNRWDEGAGFDLPFSERMAAKALMMVGRLDSSLTPGWQRGLDEGAPESWVVQTRRSDEVEMRGKGGWRFGLYAAKTEQSQELVQHSGPPVTPRVLMDADLAVGCLSGMESPAILLAHHGGLCGFERVTEDMGMGDGFSHARRSDPRGAFGSVVGLNREVDSALAKALAAAFIEAVVAPAFSAEARAELGRTRIRLLQTPMDEVAPSTMACRSTRWGMMLGWSGGGCDPEVELLSRRPAEPDELEALALAWRLVRQLPGLALVASEPNRLVAAAWAQTSLREAIVAVKPRLVAAVGRKAVACDSSFRFAEDVDILANCGVSALLHLGGAPRQSEIIERVDELGMVMQVIDELSLGGKV
ncbi:MAG: hypothetical protein JRF33_13250 [Deltaproteobacteria bacterium]|nr:hypothetical protein [Deltaproteobacteria bacterium]